MFVAASLALLAAAFPQGSPSDAGQNGGGQNAGTDAAAQIKPSLLTQQEQAALRKRLREYLLADEAYLAADSANDRQKTAKKRDSAKSSFEDEWAKFEKKGNLLASMPDVRAIFWNCFERKRPSHSKGQLREGEIKSAGLSYYYYLPKNYREDEPMPALLVLPGSSDSKAPGTWTKATDCFRTTLDKTPLADDFILHVCQIPDNLEMDPAPDYSREGADIEEDRRIRTVFLTFGEVMASYNVDRARMFLDCGRDTCGFGLRLLTLFPDRIAGLVLRAPTAVDDIRLGSLHGTPMLLLRTKDTQKQVDELKERLEQASPGTVTVLDAADEYPHVASSAAIAEWLKDKRRNMTPAKVVIEPNHDRFNRAYWVDIDKAVPIGSAARDKMPRIEVEADRKNNRIVVKSVGVESFWLFLNDELVDLDKEFVVVVNDKAVSEQRTRSFRDMLERMLDRNDWDYLFPVRFDASVPKE